MASVARSATSSPVSGFTGDVEDIFVEQDADGIAVDAQVDEEDEPLPTWAPSTVTTAAAPVRAPAEEARSDRPTRPRRSRREPTCFDAVDRAALADDLASRTSAWTKATSGRRRGGRRRRSSMTTPSPRAEDRTMCTTGVPMPSRRRSWRGSSHGFSPLPHRALAPGTSAASLESRGVLSSRLAVRAYLVHLARLATCLPAPRSARSGRVRPTRSQRRRRHEQDAARPELGHAGRSPTRTAVLITKNIRDLCKIDDSARSPKFDFDSSGCSLRRPRRSSRRSPKCHDRRRWGRTSGSSAGPMRAASRSTI